MLLLQFTLFFDTLYLMVQSFLLHRGDIEMDNTRITISMEQRERAALMKLARSELREPRDQARYIIRRELERLGLLSTVDATQEQNRKERYDTD